MVQDAPPKVKTWHLARFATLLGSCPELFQAAQAAFLEFLLLGPSPTGAKRHWWIESPLLPAPLRSPGEKRSASWPFHCGCIHVTGVPADLPAASFRLDRGRSDTVRLHLPPRPADPFSHPVDKPTQSVLFFRRLRIGNRYHAPLAFSRRLARLAPRARFLPTKSGFLQNHPDPFGANIR